MRKTFILGICLLLSAGCAAPYIPPPTPTATRLPESTPEPTRVSTGVAPSPWPTLISPLTLAPEPTVVQGTPIAVNSGTNPVPSGPVATNTPPLYIICPSNRLEKVAGAGLVIVSNYIGQAGSEIDLQVGGIRCGIRPNSKGYFQLDPGTFQWTANVPARGKLGRIRGNITVSAGVNSPGMVFCEVDGELATIPACPGGGPGPGGPAAPGPGSGPQRSTPTRLPR